MATENKINFEQQTILEKIEGLYKLQKIDSNIDAIKLIKGELPLEVRDLEDGIAGFNIRKQNLETSIHSAKSLISSQKEQKKEHQALIDKYQEQIKTIKNNREYDSFNREIEYSTLQIELAEKEISKFDLDIIEKKSLIEELKAQIDEKKQELKIKKAELHTIQTENKQEEESLTTMRDSLIIKIEPRLLYAYSRIRNSVINKIAVAHIEREACSGCNSKIPPQRQIEIKSNRKIITCEFCGRILIDNEVFEAKVPPQPQIND